jgi:hypothetical protein
MRVAGSTRAQVTPEREPVAPTQTRECRLEAATVTGKEPGRARGVWMGVRSRGEVGEMVKEVRVLEPGFMRRRSWGVGD